MENVIRVGDNEVVVGEYKRTDTTTYDYSDTSFFKQGGLTIERAHLTYTPFDWFNVIAGRYLTPYGIWNTDHGAPVIIPVMPPYMQTREMVPLAQTGLQIYGRLYPRYDLFFDYKVTLSNGRGPTEEVMDYDENKGVGLRLRLSYEGDDVTVAGGGYGYYGKYTDIIKRTILEMNSDMTLDENAEHPLLIEVNQVEVYDEYIATADLLIELFGVRLQSEFVWRYVKYETAAMRSDFDKITLGASTTEEIYNASNVGIGYYVLLAWTLPLSKWIGDVRITPYAMIEQNENNDTLPAWNQDIYYGGLNVKPSPYVTLKGEFLYCDPKSDLYGKAMKAIIAQLAVSF